MNDYCNDVNEWLTVGGDLSLAKDLTGLEHDAIVADLVGRGVTHVLDLRSEWSDEKYWAEKAPAVQYLHAPITDSASYFVGEKWYTSVEDFVQKFWLESADGDRLYVHCHMGINRAPSAAMLALLSVNSDLDPYAAFLAIREARPASGLVYAEQVGRRHLRNLWVENDEERYAALGVFEGRMQAYWTSDRVREVNRGIAYFRSAEGGTVKVGAAAGSQSNGTGRCPAGNATHRMRYGSGPAFCLDCDREAVAMSLEEAVAIFPV